MIVKAQGCDEDLELVQRGLQNLERWRTLNGLEFNENEIKDYQNISEETTIYANFPLEQH